MIRSALVCTDGSPYGRTAVAFARDWAARLNLQLKVLFVEDVRLTCGPLATFGPTGLTPAPACPSIAFYDDLVESLRKQGETALAGARQALEGLTAPVEFVQRTGLACDVILEEARTVELVCLGHRGEHAEWDTRDLGSTAYKVLRRSRQPCLVTPAQFRPLGKLLVAYDGSPPAARALRQACELAEALRLPLAVVTVAHTPESRTHYEAILAEARKLLEPHGEIKCAFELLTGEKTEALIAEHAAQGQAGLIVMGAYGHSRVREWLLGSTTTGVLVSANRPVLLLR